MQATSSKALFERLQQHKVLIIGDVMIDSYLLGSVDRISPEAPVPVVNVQQRYLRLGGAANVALNIKAMGATPILCSVVGQDDKAAQFLERLQIQKLETCGIVQSAARITTTKHRIMGNAVQMLRVDEEDSSPLNQNDETLLLRKIEEILHKHTIDAIVLQDYDKGVLNTKLIQAVIQLAGNIPIAVDPKYKNFDAYTGITLFKPNLKELKEGAKLNHLDISQGYEALKKANEQLLHSMQLRYLFTTLSEHGVLISERLHNEKVKHHHIEAHLRHIADVSGAGDTVISLTALCLASGLSAYQTAYLSNLAGGLVCESPGVVPINKSSLEKELATHWNSFTQEA